MNVEVLTQILIMALLLEALVQTIKPLWKPESATIEFYVTLAVGMVVSVFLNYLAGLDIFAAAGIPLVKAPIVGVLATGVLASRGSNFIHDLAKTVIEARGYLKSRYETVKLPQIK